MNINLVTFRQTAGYRIVVKKLLHNQRIHKWIEPKSTS